MVLSGGNHLAVRNLIHSIGIANPEDIIGDATPVQKAEDIKTSKSGEGDAAVYFCGDGTNDSLSLLAADVSIAVAIGGGGSPIALSSAGIVLFAEDLAEGLTRVFAIAGKVQWHAVEALGWSVVYHLMVLLLTSGVFGQGAGGCTMGWFG